MGRMSWATAILTARDIEEGAMSRVVYNPPPGWESAPSGWVPPADWQPPPAWPSLP